MIAAVIRTPLVFQGRYRRKRRCGGCKRRLSYGEAVWVLIEGRRKWRYCPPCGRAAMEVRS